MLMYLKAALLASRPLRGADLRDSRPGVIDHLEIEDCFSWSLAPIAHLIIQESCPSLSRALSYLTMPEYVVKKGDKELARSSRTVVRSHLSACQCEAYALAGG